MDQRVPFLSTGESELYVDMGDGTHALRVVVDGDVGGGASAAEITAALTATNANMEASLQSIATESVKVGSTIINGKQLIGGAADKWRDSFETLDASKWDYVNGVSVKDLVTLAGNTTASGFVELNLNATSQKSASEIKGLRQFNPPYRFGFGASVSQRQFGEITIISVSEVDETGARVIAAGETESFFGPDLTINRISVTSNVAVVTFNAPHNLKFDDLVAVSNAPDNRMNVQARVTQVRSKFAVTIPLTYTNGNYSLTATMNRIVLSKGSANCAGVAYMDNATANGVYFSRGQGSPEFLSAASSFGTSYTDALVPSAQPFAINLQPRFNTEFVGTFDLQRWMAAPMDSATVGTMYKRTQAIPDPSKNYAVFVDVIALPNRAAPLEIVSVVKTGTTTATVTTAQPHNLVTGAYVFGYGSRDQTSLPNLTTATSITVTGANTFTVVWGTAVTQTYYGGVIIPANGGYAVVGAINTAVTGTSWYNGRLYCGLTTTTGIAMGDVVRLLGLKDTTGAARAGTSGRFRVVAINPNIQEAGIAVGASTTAGTPTLAMSETGAAPFGSTLTFTGAGANSIVTGVTANSSLTVSANATATASQLQDVALVGVLLEPIDFSAPANGQPLVNLSAGALYRETSVRMNFARCLDYTRTPVEITGAHYTGDTQQALPVQTPTNLSVAAIQGTAASIGTEGVGAWITRGSAFTTTDIASAALTTIGQTTSTGISISGNIGAMQINCDVSAASGTSRMFTRLQGSFDGTNFVNVYDIGLITNATSKNNDTPVIPIEFRTIRYVRDLRGTTPSLTNSVNRTVRPFEIAKRQRRLIDRVVGLTTTTASTEWLYVGGCASAQLMCTAIAGMTTAAVLKVQLCQGDPTVAANWYDIPGAPTLTTSATALAVTAAFAIGQAKFMRLVPTTAGVAVTADTYELSVTAWE